MTRQAHGAVCRCGAAIIAGYDADVCALQARVEPPKLTRAGELLAVCDSRQVYARDLDGALHRRDRWMLRSPSRHAVYAEHLCGHPLPPSWLLPIPAAPAPTILTPEEGIPF